ncbi:hypothetical protein L2E82_26330 [Cichorium intybus]|uniref:Uncharacterized protein n=1 Tax=Cichorium intybus TaxID=13427 RepID=A0ACB9CQF0_CICIN|nr:hypothetical protein L2E82_26330 [Cichorium intybus]
MIPPMTMAAFDMVMVAAPLVRFMRGWDRTTMKVDPGINEHYKKTLVYLKSRSNGVALVNAERNLSIAEAKLKSDMTMRAKEQQGVGSPIIAHEEEVT